MVFCQKLVWGSLGGFKPYGIMTSCDYKIIIQWHNIAINMCGTIEDLFPCHMDSHVWRCLGDTSTILPMWHVLVPIFTRFMGHT